MPVCQAIAKYGKDNFAIKELCSCVSQGELDEKEIFYTNELNTWSPNGYNLRAGHGKGIMSEETRAKIAAANIGKKATPEARKNMSEAHRGKTLSPEQRQKISEANKGENNPFFGKKHTQESIDKFSKTYTLISPNGEVMTIKNMAEHCRKYNLHKGNMNSMAKGNRPSCQGWRLLSF